MFTLRPYRPADAGPLLALFRDTVHRVNARDYAPRQLAAWAPDRPDPEPWARRFDGRFDGRFAVVAEQAGRPVGFIDLTPDGHIDRLFVSADHQRTGIGTALMAAVLTEARRLALPRLTADVSLTARPFFLAHGFAVLAEQTVHVRGADFTNFRMAHRADEVSESR